MERLQKQRLIISKMSLPDDFSNSPALSVVLVTSDNFATIQKTVLLLRAQTVREKIELVLVAPSVAELNLPTNVVEVFASHQIVEVGDNQLIARARAAGGQAAKAPIVAYAEDHCFPAPDWAEKIIDAPWNEYSAVAPRFCNANRRTAQSCAEYLLNFGTWDALDTSREMTILPWHNTAYKREVLCRYGDGLIELLKVEGELQNDITRRGERLYFESAARVHHLNMSDGRSVARDLWASGRLFGSRRAHLWKPLRRVAYALLAPLVFIARLRGQLAHLQRHAQANTESPVRVFRIGALIMLGSLLHIAGEIVGVWRGEGGAAERKSEHETHRLRYLCRADHDDEIASLRELEAAM